MVDQKYAGLVILQPIMEAMIDTIAVDIRSQPKSMSSKGIGTPTYISVVLCLVENNVTRQRETD